MKTIRELKLANNKLELIPDGVEKMSALRHLDIQGNFLRFFPKVLHITKRVIYENFIFIFKIMKILNRLLILHV